MEGETVQQVMTWKQPTMVQQALEDVQEALEAIRAGGIVHSQRDRK